MHIALQESSAQKATVKVSFHINCFENVQKKELFSIEKYTLSLLQLCFSSELWCAKLYQDGTYGGWVEEIGVGNSTLVENRANSVSSVKINAGCNFTGYTDSDFRGNFETLIENTDQVSNDDQFSSYTCECDGKYFLFQF